MIPYIRDWRELWEWGPACAPRVVREQRVIRVEVGMTSLVRPLILTLPAHVPSHLEGPVIALPLMKQFAFDEAAPPHCHVAAPPQRHFGVATISAGPSLALLLTV